MSIKWVVAQADQMKNKYLTFNNDMTVNCSWTNKIYRSFDEWLRTNFQISESDYKQNYFK